MSISQKSPRAPLGLLGSKKIFATLLIMALGLLWSSASIAQTKFFSAPKYGFSLEMPQKWQKMSDEDYSAFTTHVLRSTGVNREKLPSYILESMHYDDSENIQILIFVKRTPNPAKILFEELIEQNEKDKRVIHDAIRQVEKEFSSYQISIGTPKLVFDERTGYLWSHSTSSIGQIEGSFSSLAVMIPTSYGFIHLTGTVPKEKYPAFIQTFHQIVSSIKVDQHQQR